MFSRTNYVIKYTNCPVISFSKLQTKITLSTTESEYVALSQSLRDAIPLLLLMQELAGVIPMLSGSPKVHCTIFQDNQGCIDLVKCPKMRPQTKHIALKYHHFRQHVLEGIVTVERIDTKNQQAGIFTKGLDKSQFCFFRQKIMGW